MNKILIHQFGPICEAEIDLDKKMQVFIGTQASGKSTACKVIYYCQKIRDYTLEFLMDGVQYTDNHKNEYFNNYMKYLTRQFMGCFGKRAPHPALLRAATFPRRGKALSSCSLKL